MSGYLLAIIGIVTLSALLSVILPEGKTNKLIQGIAKIACLSVILSPVLSFFQSGVDEDGNINFLVFSSQTVIETDEAFIDYCSMKRIENAETEIEKDLEKTFSVQTKVTLDWEYSSAASERTGTDIQITKVEIRAEEEIEEGLLSEIGRHIFENYGCEVEFV